MTLKVLVVDDEAPIANVVALKLRNAGLQVTVALDGAEAYEQAVAERPDLLITDLQMPGVSGLELCARLMDAFGGEGVPTLLLTGTGFEVDRKSLSHVPVCLVMTKPFSPRELLAQVLEVLGQSAA